MTNGVQHLQPMVNSAYQDLYEQYLVEASFLWLLRSQAVEQPHYMVADIVELEGRVDAYLDSLVISPEQAWLVCEEALTLGGAGEVFAAAVVAFRSLEIYKIQRVVEIGFCSDECFAGLASALAWLPAKYVHPWIKRFLTSKDLNHKYLAITACSLRREDPGHYLLAMLQREDCLAHTKLYARCLRLVGELKRRDLHPALLRAMQSANQEIIFWSTWAATVLGHRLHAANLKPFVMSANRWQDRAIQLAFRALPIADARAWVSELAHDSQQRRNVIKAAAALGDPHAIDWLISTMRDPQYAQVAGEAFTLVTGIDLDKNDLSLNVPDLSQSIPNGDPEDPETAMDEDENLPWPDADRLAAAWRRYGTSYTIGTRYFMGKPTSAAVAKDVLAHGKQRQRHAAALVLALLEPETPLPNTRCKDQGVQ